MSELEALIRGEIAREGSISFRRYMELALYLPGLGYYRKPRDPFGKAGDFYTAEQFQPVFGVLIAARLRALGVRDGETVVELGAGRGEMAEAFSAFDYVPLDVARGELPARFRGAVFANEFFDALPLEVGVKRGGGYRELRVASEGDRFVWIEGGPMSAAADDYIARYLGPRNEGEIVEANLDALAWLDRVARSLEAGVLLVIDYGYTRREFARFPQGTLMSYRKHQALEDVLTDPGERDITAHVCFTALEEHGRARGLTPAPLESLARTLMDAGEPDQFAAALAADSAAEQERRRLQLKTLLFGMGERFRTLILRKGAPAAQ